MEWMQVDDNEYAIGSLGDWINWVPTNPSAFTKVLNFRHRRYVVEYPTSFISYDRNLHQHCKDYPNPPDLHHVVDAVFHEEFSGDCEVLMDAAMRAFDGNWHNSSSCTLMCKFLEAPYGFGPSDC